jgi:hypothetical protein
VVTISITTAEAFAAIEATLPNRPDGEVCSRRGPGESYCDLIIGVARDDGYG